MKNYGLYFLLLMIVACGKKNNPVPITIEISDFTQTIDENPMKGQILGSVSASTNQGSITFSLTDQSPSGALGIDTTTGELRVVDSIHFDYEKNTEVTAKIEAKNGNITSTANVTINLNNLQIPQTNLLAFYPFNNNANDESSNNNNGTVSGVSSVNDRRNIPNAAYQFSNANANVDLGDLNFFDANTKFSTSFWIKPTASLSNSTIISKLSQNVSCGEQHQEFIVRIRDGKIAPIYYHNSTSAVRGFRGNTTLKLDQWYHVVINYDGSLNTNDGKDRLEIFINGAKELFTLRETSGTVPSMIENTASRLGIGNRLKSNGAICVDVPFKGIIDDVAFYNRLLTTNEATLIWKDNF